MKKTGIDCWVYLKKIKIKQAKAKMDFGIDCWVYLVWLGIDCCVFLGGY